ncbi:hypothetical protein ACFWNQ_22525 [Streptomyces virginiae]|uniref:hypothetical protein n=1 Tax=Streptomyces virginiae TaxID=1961 RepID=UPI003658DB3A
MSLAAKTSLVVRDRPRHGHAGSGSDQPLILAIHQEGPVASEPRALPALPHTDRSPGEEPPERELPHIKNPKLTLDAFLCLRDLGTYQPAGILFGQHRSMVPCAESPQSGVAVPCNVDLDKREIRVVLAVLGHS